MALATAIALSTAPARADETGSRWLAALPFGVGQFQNGDVGLGIFFAAGQALLAGTSIATRLMVSSLASQSPAGPRVDIPALNARLATAVTVNRIAFAGWAALTVAGVVEAEVSFGPRRAAPREPSIKATAAPLPGGGMVGLRASF
jgi:hypothetical protein